MKIEPQNALMRALHFEEADLAANRLGQFTERQHLQLKQNEQDFRIIATTGLLILLIIGFAYLSRLEAGIACLAGLLFVVVVAVSSLFAVQRGTSTTRELRSQVLMLEGDVKPVSRFDHFHPQLGTQYMLIINRRRWQVSREVFNAFSSGRYRIYYAPETKVWLSAERIAEGKNS